MVAKRNFHFVSYVANSGKKIFTFCAKTRSAPQNDRLNLYFVKNTYVDGEKVARNGRKTAISKKLNFRLFYCHLYLPLGELSRFVLDSERRLELRCLGDLMINECHQL